MIIPVGLSEQQYFDKNYSILYRPLEHYSYIYEDNRQQKNTQIRENEGNGNTFHTLRHEMNDTFSSAKFSRFSFA